MLITRSPNRRRIPSDSLSATFAHGSWEGAGRACLEWLKFLRVIDEVTPSDKEIHLIADNYATHKHPKVQRWLARHPRFHIYFTPTSSSWLNMVERFFRDLTQNQLRRGIFRDVEELIRAIGDYIDKHNDNPKPFVWTAKATDILEKVKRARKALDIG